jgi:uncharacterized membrane protein
MSHHDHLAPTREIEPLTFGGTTAGRALNTLLFAAFLICVGSRALTFKLASHNEALAWLDALCLVTAAATTIVAQTKRLPTQNVVLSAVLIALVGGAVQYLGATRAHIPFGPIQYLPDAGPRIADVLPWLMPLLWVVVILNARGVARLIVRPWRKTRTYGLRIILLTCVLAVAFAFGLEPFAIKVNSYWKWESTQGGLSWHTAPWINFVSWFLTALLIMAFTTPFLMKKRPARTPSDFHPLGTWVVMNGLFIAGAFLHRPRLWDVVGLAVITTVVAAVLALRGAHW